MYKIQHDIFKCEHANCLPEEKINESNRRAPRFKHVCIYYV